MIEGMILFAEVTAQRLDRHARESNQEKFAGLPRSV